MKMMKRVLTLIGFMSLMVASMVNGNVAAGQIETTLTVDTSVEACPDTKPSQINFRSPQAPLLMPFSGITPTSPTASYIATSQNANVDFYINTCNPGNQWNAYVSVPDFNSGGHTLTSVNNVWVRGHSSASFTGITEGGYSSPNVTVGVQSHMTTVYVPYTGSPIKISSGTATNPVPNPPGTGFTANGGWSQNLQFEMRNIPGTTPPGTYVSNVVLTLTVAEP